MKNWRMRRTSLMRMKRNGRMRRNGNELDGFDR